MQRVAIDITVASALFFVLTLLLDAFGYGEGFEQATVITAAFRTLIFAMIYAAIRVGMILWKDSKGGNAPTED